MLTQIDDLAARAPEINYTYSLLSCVFGALWAFDQLHGALQDVAGLNLVPYGVWVSLRAWRSLRGD